MTSLGRMLDKAVVDTQAAFQAADDAWGAELVKVFGKAAGDARYDARGRSTAELARLHDIRVVAMQEWHAAIDARRGAHVL